MAIRVWSTGERSGLGAKMWWSSVNVWNVKLGIELRSPREKGPSQTSVQGIAGPRKGGITWGIAVGFKENLSEKI